MGYYSQHFHNVPGSDNDSLVIAFANLLQDLGVDTKPKELLEKIHKEGQSLSWDSITDFDERIYPSTIGEPGAWPEVENSLVKFRCISQRTGLPVDHYCLVVDPHNHVVIDSLDGERKMPGVYGTPTGWAAFVRDDTPLGPEDAVEELPEEATPPAERESDPNAIRFEALDEPIDMHVIHPISTRKYAFGRHIKWTDIQETGRLYKENTNVKIVAYAYVPVEDQIAKFAMEQTDFGDNYELTHRIKWAIGFNHSQLADGHVEEVKKPAPAPAPAAKTKKEEIDEWFEEKKRVSTDPETGEINYNLYKTTYKPFPDCEHETVVEQPLGDGRIYKDKVGYTVFLANETVMLHDIETKRPDRPLYKHKGIMLTGTFWYDGEEYGRPLRGPDSWHWYGVPMDKVTKESEVFDPTLNEAEDSERIRAGRLYPIERYWYDPLARTLSQYTKMKLLVRQQIQKIRSK